MIMSNPFLSYMKGLINLIAKDREIPLKIKVCEAILRRILLDHISRQALQEELNRRWAGYRGEQSLDYYLSFLDEQKFLIFHDLNLPRGEYTFQIDTLLLTTNFALIIEVKNISGTLFFDQVSHQLIRTNADGKEESFPDPISQVKLHHHQLEKFLKKHHLPEVPIEYVVVVTNKTSIIKTNPGYQSIFQKVFKSPQLLTRIKELERIYQTEVITAKELRKISKFLIKSNTPPRKLYLEKYLTSTRQLRKGIHCPSCSAIPMIRKKRQWFCPSCNTYSKDAHLESLRDYFLLFDDSISKRKFKEFANLNSNDVATRLLVSTNFPTSGTTRDKRYHPPADLY